MVARCCFLVSVDHPLLREGDSALYNMCFFIVGVHSTTIYLFLIGGYLLYNIMLVSAIQEHESGSHKYRNVPSLLNLPCHPLPHPNPLGCYVVPR